MPDPLITLTTDFGEDSPYVAAMKGVILSVNPGARLLDLSHQVPPQDVRHAAHFMAGAVPYFPAEVLHVVVVDPGVGTERAILYVEVGPHRLLVPDNGCWTLLPGEPMQVIRLAEPRYWRPQVSNTFHGRDIFAPAAGHLSLGLDPAQLGPAATSWVRLPVAQPTRTADGIVGEVVFVDHFGNLITNIPAELLDRPAAELRVGPVLCQGFTRVPTYSAAEPGRVVLLTSSSGFLEVAVVQGSAAQRLGVAAGAVVRVDFA